MALCELVIQKVQIYGTIYVVSILRATGFFFWGGAFKKCLFLLGILVTLPYIKVKYATGTHQNFYLDKHFIVITPQNS